VKHLCKCATQAAHLAPSLHNCAGASLRRELDLVVERGARKVDVEIKFSPARAGDRGDRTAGRLRLVRWASCGSSANEAMAKAEVLALRVLAERLEHGEVRPIEINISLPAAA
jgi:hypothetical protein